MIAATAGTIEAAYLSWEEAAVFTGLSVTTLRNLAREGRLRKYPVGKRILLKRTELIQVIEGGDDDGPQAA